MLDPNKVKQFLEGDVSRRTKVGATALENTLIQAIQNAIDGGVPQGFIVSLLHAHALQQTQRMIDGFYLED